MALSARKKKQETLIEEINFQAVTIIYPADAPAYLFMKRIMDIAGAVIGLLVLLPLLLLVSLCIKLEDPTGSVLFKQKRAGRNGEFFDMYKFRSMVCNAEELKLTLLTKNEATGPVFKIRNDPRVTKIGRIIRKTSIDELPQLLNVLRGEMSLVGPRPALPEEVEQYNLREKQRLSVVPGLTCYWQVSGRGIVTFEEWVEMDLDYIQERNFWVDVLLIFRTVLVLFGSKNAY